jgi:excisionase family DNA binding protein
VPDTPADEIPPIFITVDEAMRVLAMEEHTIRRLCRDNVIASARHGRRLVVSLASVREYAAALLAEESA